jgi:hypothetical protein
MCTSMYMPANDLNANTVAQMQATLRQRTLRDFVGRVLLGNFETQDLTGLGRFLKNFARSPFPMDMLRKASNARI